MEKLQQAVQAATVSYSVTQRAALRAKLRYGAFLAWHRVTPKSTGDRAAYFAANAGRFGEFLASSLPADLRGRLQGVLDSKNEPFLVVKGIFSRRWLQKSIATALKCDPEGQTYWTVGERASRILESRRYDIIASALIATAGARLRPEVPGGIIFRDFVTHPGAEHSQFITSSDMHLRFRTAAPERSPGNDDSVRVVVYACIENAVADPVYLLRTSDIIACLKARNPEALDLLRRNEFAFYDKRSPATFAKVQANLVKPILFDAHPGGDPWLAYDPERLDLNHLRTLPAELSAVDALIESIHLCAVRNAQKIVLQRGDALVIDNRRALTRRHEAVHHMIDLWSIGRPALRWLRFYYGFTR